MCDVLSLTTGITELTQYFGIDQVQFDYKPRHNIAPTQQLPVMRHIDGKRYLQQFRWGLMPFWAKDAVVSDSESVLEKRAYRRMFAKQRCIIPCTGFNVSKAEGKLRRQVRIVLKEKQVFGIAGLFDIWKDQRGNDHGTCTIMTTRSNRLLYDYTPAMPAILREDEISSWLDPGRDQEPDYLQTLLKPYHPDFMHCYPVTSGVRDAVEEPDAWDDALPAKYALLKR